jgi:hypothetical protein
MMPCSCLVLSLVARIPLELACVAVLTAATSRAYRVTELVTNHRGIDGEGRATTPRRGGIDLDGSTFARKVCLAACLG